MCGRTSLRNLFSVQVALPAVTPLRAMAFFSVPLPMSRQHPSWLPPLCPELRERFLLIAEQAF
jgi:hypothetical protein